MHETLEELVLQIRQCRVCAPFLPHEPRPVVRLHRDAVLLIAGQAPGARVHASGVPWDDPSGDRLRAWMNVDRPLFYDSARVAVLPMGFCFPGTRNGADLPPRPECAPLWRQRALDLLKSVRLTLLVGAYAQAWGLKSRDMTNNVRRWRAFGADTFPLPHPSWRNTSWLKRNPWFETETLPDLRARVAQVLSGGS